MSKLVWALLATLSAPGLGHADAGVVRLRQAVDTVVVTVFTSPTPLRAGPVDVEVLVQDRVTLAPRPDVRIALRLENDALLREGGDGEGQPAAADHADNRLLRAARLRIPEPGHWRLRVEASGSDFDVQLATSLDVGESRSPLRRHWAALALPPFGVALFALHQRLRRRLASSGRSGRRFHRRALRRA